MKRPQPLLFLGCFLFALVMAHAAATPTPTVSLGGEVGAAADAAVRRFRSAPFDSLAWLRADLTGEQVSDFDNKWGHIQNRPFKNYSGDISGRFIEVMALSSQGNLDVHPTLKNLLTELPKLQQPEGYFSASGTIDWTQPIDYHHKPEARMMPALWGNARLLCGLVEADRAFAGAELMAVTKRLGDFYVGILPRFTDPARMAEYKGGDTYVAAYVTCYFPAMEGLVKLHVLTGEPKYLDTAARMADFYQAFDHLPIDHAHGMLCNQVALLLLHEATGDPRYLKRVEARWDELVAGGYINPAGGVLEACHTVGDRDEGCAIADWLRLNLELGRVTGKSRYYAMAERTLHNHLLQNQTPTGGFGHRNMLCDATGVVGFQRHHEEATWCCDFHGALGFLLLRNHLVMRKASAITCPLALDFKSTDATGTVISQIEPAGEVGEVLRQHVRLDNLPGTVVRVRKAHWAELVKAVDSAGKDLPLVAEGDYVATTKPVSEVTFIFRGGVYAENRRCTRLVGGPTAGEPFVLLYGPKVLATTSGKMPMVTWPMTLDSLKTLGMLPLAAAMCQQECRFVVPSSSGSTPASQPQTEPSKK